MRVQSVKMTKQNLQRKISRDSLFRTYTRTGDALNYVLKRFKNEARMNDPSVAKYLMVMTDGKSTGISIKSSNDLIWSMVPNALHSVKKWN